MPVLPRTILYYIHNYILLLKFTYPIVIYAGLRSSLSWSPITNRNKPTNSCLFNHVDLFSKTDD